MQDHGASHAIIQHHNRATIEGEMATGMLEQLYIEWGGYYVKTLPFEYSSMGKSPFFFFFTFLVKLWTPEKIFIPQKNRVGETRGKPLKLVFGYVCDFNLNCCGAVFFPEPNCVQKEPAPVHPATLRYRHQCIRLSSHFFLLYMSLSLSLFPSLLLSVALFVGHSSGNRALSGITGHLF